MNKTPQTKKVDVLIIGAGPAGLSSGIYAARSNLKTIILEGKKPSALHMAKEIKNYPGFDKISGSSLLKKMKEHARGSGAEIKKGDVISATLDMDPKMVTTRDNIIYMAKSVIVATGRQFNKKTIENEEKYIGKGVSYCALCDGPLYREQPVVIYGDDEEAVEDVLALHQMDAQVRFITTKSLEKISESSENPYNVDSLIEKVQSNEIGLMEHTKVTEIVGSPQEGVKGIKVIKNDNENGIKEEEKQINTNALFIISHVLSNRLFKNAGLKIEDKGWIKVDENLNTNQSGVFAAGDITGKWLQVVEAVAEGGKAGVSASRWVRKKSQKAS